LLVARCVRKPLDVTAELHNYVDASIMGHT
jgi:hypothetical protein